MSHVVTASHRVSVVSHDVRQYQCADTRVAAIISRRSTDRRTERDKTVAEFMFQLQKDYTFSNP